MRDDTFPNRPDLDAYSRVTEPERFRPLHRLALDLVHHLEGEYAVIREERFELLPWMAPFEHAHPPLTLFPITTTAAPIAIAFTAFPSVVVRFGRWVSEPYPSCACDACAETATGAGARLEEHVRNVVSGRFMEELFIPWVADARLGWSFGDFESPSRCQRGWTSLPRSHALALGRRGSHVVRWSPWAVHHDGRQVQDTKSLI
jgi:hypothetical protein